MKNVCITGGAGFIGSNLCSTLIAAGHRVTIIDNLSTGRLENVPSSTLVELLVEDLKNVPNEFFSNFDVVFHFAAQTSVQFSIANFSLSSTQNITDAIKIIDACSINKIPLIYASSSAVYGNSLGDDQREIFEPLSPYAVDKLLLEKYCSMASINYGLKSFGFRCFNVYGPHQMALTSYGGVIPRFMQQLLDRQPLTTFGGSQTRDFIFVSDVVTTFAKAMDYLEITKGPTAIVSNLATGRSVSINSLASLMKGLVDYRTEVVSLDPKKGDIAVSEATTNKLSELTNPSQFTTLNKGLKITWEWYIEKYPNIDCVHP